MREIAMKKLKARKASRAHPRRIKRRVKKVVENNLVECWHDCICQREYDDLLEKGEEDSWVLNPSCESGLFSPFNHLSCGLDARKLCPEPKRNKNRSCDECGTPTRRSNLCSKCANRMSRERRGIFVDKELIPDFLQRILKDGR